MKTEHHYQKIETPTGYLIATREDTEKYQDLDIREYTPEGDLYFEKRIIYNIQYDYIRSQAWQGGKLTYDAIKGMDTYGHLQYEYTAGGIPAPEGWVNPYPDNHEPVRAEGSDMFRSQGIAFIVSFRKARINAHANIYIWDVLDDYYHDWMANLITNIEPATPRDIEDWQKEDEEELGEYSAAEAAKQRMKALRKHGRKIGVDIPIDPRFID